VHRITTERYVFANLRHVDKKLEASPPPRTRTTMNVPAEVATGTKADAVDAKRAKIARIRAIILVIINIFIRS
jgi:hypothetical protein